MSSVLTSLTFVGIILFETLLVKSQGQRILSISQDLVKPPLFDEQLSTARFLYTLYIVIKNLDKYLVKTQHLLTAIAYSIPCC